jgi:hypothetical protein
MNPESAAAYNAFPENRSFEQNTMQFGAYSAGKITASLQQIQFTETRVKPALSAAW